MAEKVYQQITLVPETEIVIRLRPGTHQHNLAKKLARRWDVPIADAIRMAVIFAYTNGKEIER